MTSGKSRNQRSSNKRTSRPRTASSEQAQVLAHGNTEVQPSNGLLEEQAVAEAPGSRVPLLVGGSLILGILIVVFISLLLFAPGVVSKFFPTIGASPTPVSVVTNDVARTDGRIMFIRRSTDGKNRDIFVVNADGSDQEQVTSGIFIEGTAAWAPDGQHIIAQVSMNSVSTIARFAVGPDNRSTEQVLLTADIKADSAFPAWSPDGKKVAFQSKRDGDLSQVFVMDADGNNKARVSDGTGFDGQPAWSPDGKSIAYAGGAQQVSGAEREIYVVPASGGTPVQITNAGSSLTTPVWSPNGNQIMCLQIVGERDYKILIMNADGSNLRTLFEGGAISGISFSPDGSSVLFYNIGDQGEAVHTVTVDDGTDTSITAAGNGDYYPVWSPDGTQIAWASSADKQLHKIVAAKADGSGRRILSTGAGDDYGTSWALLK
ncbi:MAG TPA: hypothetical protein VLQ48_14865 [Chloroflexia bacterium]|nr:hypothetical protein [Chloroflexia bacterium]